MRSKIYDNYSVCSECKRKVQEHSSKNKERTIRSWVVLCNRCRKYIDTKYEQERDDTINFYDDWIRKLEKEIKELKQTKKEKK